MARTTINPVTLKQAYAAPFSADALDVTMTAADANGVSNGFQTAMSTKMLFRADNTGGSAYTVTISSVADELGRTGDITTYSIGAGETIQLIIPAKGFQQADGNLYYICSNIAIKFCISPLT